MCNFLFKNQTKAIIKMDAEENISGAVSKIQFRKPSGAVGSFPGTITDAILGLFQYQILSTTDLDEFGDWTVWADIVYSDGKQLPGDPKIMEIRDPGVIL